MLDTIRLKFNLFLPRELLSDWTEIATLTPKKVKRLKYKKECYLVNKAPLKFIYFPNTHLDKPPLLSIEFSLPRLIYGSNHIQIFDLEQAYDQAEAIINSRLPIEVDIRAGVPNRLDFFYDYKVGEFVQPWLSVIEKLELYRRKKIIYSNEGVGFLTPTKKIIIKFYDKYLESNIQETYGYLRLEFQIRKQSEIQRVIKLGKNPIVLGDITKEIVIAQLESVLNQLGILDVDIPNPYTLQDQLMRNFSRSKAERYLGIIVSLRNMTRNEYSTRFQIPPKSLGRDLNAIRKAGIAMAISNDPLPRLKLHHV